MLGARIMTRMASVEYAWLCKNHLQGLVPLKMKKYTDDIKGILYIYMCVFSKFRRRRRIRVQQENRERESWIDRLVG